MNKNKPSVVWFCAITCNGNTHSFLSANSNSFETFLENFDLIYHPSLSIDKSLDDILSSNEKIDFLLIEGAISFDKDFFTISNDSTFNLLNLLASKSNYVIAVGSCASYGGIHAKFEKNSDIFGLEKGIKQSIKEKLKHQIINLTGCPVHPAWILQTLFTLKTFGKIALDEESRPTELYGTLAHHGCTRNEYFEWKVEGDFGKKEGCLFYDQGCRAPMTFSSCNKILWNDISSKTRAGMPCIGCTQSDFPRNDMLETKKNIGIPFEVPVGISKRAYLTITGVAKSFKIDRLHKKIMEEK